MKNRVKVTIAALAVGVLAMCGNMTGYATESASEVSTQANADGSTDAGGSNENIYKVTYNLNGGTKDGKNTYENSYYSESWSVKLSAIKPIKSGYRLTGWWYRDKNGTEQEIDTNATINLEEVFLDIREATLTAEWTQVVKVTVDGKETEVAAGNPISVNTVPLNTLKLDKWVVNASDNSEGWNLTPNSNNEGTIEVKAADPENHVINVSEKTGFGITSENPYANFVSCWSLQEGYLVQVENKTGHPLKLTDTVTVQNDDKQILEMGSQLPEKTTDGYFTIINRGINTENQAYIRWKDLYVKCISVTLDSSRVDRNIKISFDTTQAGVGYTEPKVSECILKDSNKLTPQALLDTANVTAKRDGFTKYRWTYSVKDAEKWVSAKEIPSGVWSEQSSEETDILNKKFGYSFPYYEFEFAPVWQCQINFETRFPETENAPEQPESFYKDEGSTFANFRELEDSKGRYSFNGWKLEGDTSDTLYKNNKEYEVTSPSVTFVGQWAAISYPIYWTFGYEDEELREGSFTYGKNIEFLPDPTRTGYTFLGWKMSVGDASTDNGEKISEQLYKAGDKVMMPAGVVTMTAQWKINTYTVTYDGNGTTIGVYKESDSVEYGKNYAIQQVSGITPTRYGYKFLGWRKDNEGDLLKAGGSFTMPAKDVTLVAQWERKSPDLGNKGKHDLSNGVRYTYNGAFRIKGDPSNYQDKITFYVPKAGEYTFE